MKKRNPDQGLNRFSLIAKNRGSSWLKNTAQGRVDSQLNPTMIKRLRLTLGLKQSEVARRVLLSESTFQAIERGKRPITRDKAEKILKALGVEGVDKYFGPYANKLVARLAPQG